MTFRGPSLGLPDEDGECQRTSCDDLPLLTVTARLAETPAWPLEGSFSSERAAEEGIAPGVVIETTGTVPCGDGLAAISANPISASGDLLGTSFQAEFYWVCQPDTAGPWDFQVRAAFLDIDGDLGPFSDWVSFSGNADGCEGAGPSSPPDADANDDSGCAASPGTAASGAWALLVAAAASLARRRSRVRPDPGTTA